MGFKHKKRTQPWWNSRCWNFYCKKFESPKDHYPNPKKPSRLPLVCPRSVMGWKKAGRVVGRLAAVAREQRGWCRATDVHSSFGKKQTQHRPRGSCSSSGVFGFSCESENRSKSAHGLDCVDVAGCDSGLQVVKSKRQSAAGCRPSLLSEWSLHCCQSGKGELPRQASSS